MNPVRTAVVGLGYWGPNLIRNLIELRDSDVLYACDLDRPNLDAIGARYPAVELTQRFDDVLDDDAVEAVVIATPVSTHFPLALRVLQAGKHVFVEKPLAASTDEAIQLIDEAAATGRVLMPGHTFIYSPPVRMVKDLIDSGELGDIYFVSTSRVNLGLHQSDVSVVWDLGPHDFSILSYWLGESPVRVSAWSRGCVIPTSPDVAFINLEYPQGTIAHVELSWLAPSKLRRTTVVGSRKMVVYDDTSNEPIRVFDSGVNLPDPSTFGEYRMTYRTGDIVSPNVGVAEPLALQMRDFCLAIREGVEPSSSSRLGLDVVMMAEAVDRSVAADGMAVSVGESALSFEAAIAAGTRRNLEPGDE